MLLPPCCSLCGPSLSVAEQVQQCRLSRREAREMSRDGHEIPTSVEGTFGGAVIDAAGGGWEARTFKPMAERPRIHA